MRYPKPVSALGLALVLTALACSGSEGPTSIEISIDEIEILLGVCAIPEGGTCFVPAVARADGIVVVNPVLRWWSSNPAVVAIEVGDNNTMATVFGRSLGNATVRVENSTGNVFDDLQVSVLPCSKC